MAYPTSIGIFFYPFILTFVEPEFTGVIRRKRKLLVLKTHLVSVEKKRTFSDNIK